MRSKPDPLRVLFVSHSAELNGAENMLLLTLRALDRKRFSPLLVVPRTGPLLVEAARADVPAFIVPAKWWLTGRRGIWKQPLAWLWNARSVGRMGRLIREEKVDLVVTNSAGNFGGALAARRAGVPHVWSVHEILSGPERLLSFVLGSRRLARFMRRSSAAIIVNSRATGRAFEGLGGVRLLPNGVDLRRASGRPDERLRKELGLTKRDRVLGIVGKIMPDKGQLEAVRAFAEIAPRRPGLRLLLVGSVGSAGYLRELEALVRNGGLEGRILFTGRVPDVFAYLRLMDLLLVTSRSESFGRTVIEAMAAGTPVLAAAVGGLPEIITPGRDGFLVGSTEPRVLAAAVERLLDRPGLLRRAAAQGRKTVRAKYDLGVIVREFERILIAVQAGPEAGRD
jgi:glycosyltransferase involved in cell wall biosynthesis